MTEMLENTNLADVAELIKWAAGIAVAAGILYKGIKKLLGDLFKDQTTQMSGQIKELSDRIDSVDQSLTERMDKVDMEACKNFLVQCLADVERGEPMCETEAERFWEQYEHYRSGGGNSYISQKVEKLQKAGKI